eukprot:jgi/Mesvir1/931/Mv17489-RA.1
MCWRRFTKSDSPPAKTESKEQATELSKDGKQSIWTKQGVFTLNEEKRVIHYKANPQGLFADVVAGISMAFMSGWYYFLILMLPILAVLAIFYRSIIAGTILVLIVSSSWWPMKICGKPWQAFLDSWIFNAWLSYFNFEMVVEDPLDTSHDPTTGHPKKKYLFAELPHGVFPHGEFLSMSLASRFLPTHNVTGVGASVLFGVPLLRYIFAWLGTVPATSQNISACFESGSHVGVTIGGIAEMFMVSTTQERIYLRKRKGFVRVAIKNGAAIVPIFFFGNSLLYGLVGAKNDPVHAAASPKPKPTLLLTRASTALRHLMMRASRKVHMSLLFFYGMLGPITVPYHRPIKMVLGKAIPVVQMDEPTQEEVDRLHALFVKHVEELYEKHRPEWEHRPLSIE